MPAILTAGQRALGRMFCALRRLLGRGGRTRAPAEAARPARRGARTVRSYALRSGRISPAQSRAVQQYWSRWGLHTGDGLLDQRQVYGRRAPLILEIGFGAGEALLELAKRMPGRDFVGVEVYVPGIGRLFRGMEQESVDNIRVYAEDAVEVLEKAIPAGALDAVLLLFPDPWPKKRHHKRRLVQPPFLRLLARRLRPGGLLQLATDWDSYAEQIREQAARGGDFILLGEGRPPWRQGRTRFEERAAREGRAVRELLFEHRP